MRKARNQRLSTKPRHQNRGAHIPLVLQEGCLLGAGRLLGKGVCVCVWGGGGCSFTDFGKFFNIWYPLYFIGAPDFSEMFEVYTILRQVHELLCKCRESSMYINGISFDHITSRQ